MGGEWVAAGSFGGGFGGLGGGGATGASGIATKLSGIGGSSSAGASASSPWTRTMSLQSSASIASTSMTYVPSVMSSTSRTASCPSGSAPDDDAGTSRALTVAPPSVHALPLASAVDSTSSYGSSSYSGPSGTATDEWVALGGPGSVQKVKGEPPMWISPM